jgi:hypothetical protein
VLSSTARIDSAIRAAASFASRSLELKCQEDSRGGLLRNRHRHRQSQGSTPYRG